MSRWVDWQREEIRIKMKRWEQMPWNKEEKMKDEQERRKTREGPA